MMMKKFILALSFSVVGMLMGSPMAMAYDDGICGAADVEELLVRVKEFNDSTTFPTKCKKEIVLTSTTPYVLTEPLVFSNPSVSVFKLSSTVGAILQDSGSFSAGSAVVTFKNMDGGTSNDATIAVTGIKFQTTTASAIKLESTSHAYIHDLSSVKVSAADAIVLDQSSSNTIDKVTMTGSYSGEEAHAGISITNNSNDNTLSGLNIQGFSGNGISIADSNTNTIGGASNNKNTIKDNKGHGVYMTGNAYDNDINYSNISGFGGFGLALYGLSGDTSAGNDIDELTANIYNSSISTVPADESPDGSEHKNNYILSNIPSSSLAIQIIQWTENRGEYTVYTELSGSQLSSSKEVLFFRANTKDGTTFIAKCEFTDVSGNTSEVADCDQNTAVAGQMGVTLSTSLGETDQIYAILRTNGGQISNPSDPFILNQDTSADGGSGGDGEDACDGEPGGSPTSAGSAYAGDCSDSSNTTPTWKAKLGDADCDGIQNVGEELYVSFDGLTYYKVDEFEAHWDKIDNDDNGTPDYTSLSEANADLNDDKTVYDGEDSNANCKQGNFSIDLRTWTGSKFDKASETTEVDFQETDALYWDSDEDCISDAAEVGIVLSYEGTSTTGTSVYGALENDIDKDGLCDGPAYEDSEAPQTPTTCKARADSSVDGCVKIEDKDRDGRCDSGESCANDTDSDDDQIGDYTEVMIYGTYPWDADSDWDSTTSDDPNGDDSDDVQPMNRNNSYTYDYCTQTTGFFEPDQDDDGDGLLDQDEDANKNCMWDTTETSAASKDTDADGVKDGYDTDGDLLPDGVEVRGVTNALNPDSDADGIADGAEDANQNGVRDLTESDPMKTDTDSDGILDGVEDKDRDGVYDSATETKTYETDTDSDGIVDGTEDVDHDGIVDPSETNPRDEDTDGDNEPDGSDCNPTNENQSKNCSESSYTDPEEDDDGDTLLNGAEDADGDGQWDSDETNYADKDTDDDGIRDDVELRTDIGYDPTLADSDRDGLDDGEEDVPDANGNVNGYDEGVETDALDSDTDDDDLLDGQDPEPLLAGDTTDSDGDRLPDSVEDKDGDGKKGADETDPEVADTDGDGLSDGAEDCNRDGSWQKGDNANETLETDPLTQDSDNDGRLDGEEYNGFCSYNVGTDTNPNDRDTDDDGLTDGQEIELHTDPNDKDTNNNGISDYSEEIRGQTKGGCSLVAEF